jgi:hypothetical protein
MKKLIPVLLAFILGTIVLQESFAQRSRSSKNGRSTPIQLFNGRNLDGWYTFLRDRGRDRDPKKVFTVKDGQIRISGEEWGCITTHEEFKDYKLVVEFKWGGEAFEPRKDKARIVVFSYTLPERMVTVQGRGCIR